MKDNFSSFTNCYSLQKTLKFELIPQGDTLINIEKNNIILNDTIRAEEYRKTKKIIDTYHKQVIETSLNNVKLTKLNAYYDLYTSKEDKKSDKFKKDFDKIKTELRKEIASNFSEKPTGNDFIKKELGTFAKENGLDFYKDFEKFVTYFSGFNTNRANMYSADEKSTAIAYRLINENLPKFIDNLKIFEKIKAIPEIAKDFDSIMNNLEEILNIEKLEDIFSLEYYNNILIQSQIEVYNAVIGGKTTTDGKKIQGLNEYINLYNQKQTDKSKKIPKIKLLYKQILSEKIGVSFIPVPFENINDMLEDIEKFYQNNLLNNDIDNNNKYKNLLEEITELTHLLKNFDLSKIYIKNNINISYISQKIFGDYSVIKNALEKYYIEIENPTYTIKAEKKEDKEKFYNENVGNFLKQECFSIALLQNAVDLYMDGFEDAETRLTEAYSSTCIADYFKNYNIAKQNEESNKIYDFLSNIKDKYNCIKGILNIENDCEKELTPEDKINIKIFFDSVLEILHFVKPLYLKTDSLEKDENFYSQFDPMFEEFNLFTKLYDKVRNFITKKPYSTEKIKINFECSNLLSGWAQDYNTNGGLIFEKDNNFYLAIIDKKLKNEDIDLLEKSGNNNAYKIIYDFQKPDNKQIPRLFIRSKGDNFAPAVKKYKLKINEVIDIYDSCKFKTEYRTINPIDYKKSLIKMIDYFKSGLIVHDSYKYYKFNWKNSEEYNDISEFYFDCESSCYELRKTPINFDNLNLLVKEEKLYLFKIYNKDFSDYSKGKQNLHTMYFKSLFDNENLKNVVYKLNGQAEIFHRKASVNYSNEILEKGHHSQELKYKFNYPIIKDKRFTVDKFQIHIPITLNFKAKGIDNINNDVKKFLKNNPDVNIIGIDRGERHLLYISLIDQKGNVILDENNNPIQYSLNDIVGEYKDKNGNLKQIKTSYHYLLQEKENNRSKAREDWGVIESIKELKDGYLSQVVHLISNLMVKYNAIIVMEDLNFGFKKGRFKVEKQVYQKFEKMIIDKLNYLVFKEKLPNETGGIYNALQLTSKFTSFKELGKQCGFVFYTPPWNTSKIDPTTGFVDLLKPKYKNIKNAQDFFSNFDNIKYNQKENYFEFTFDYNNFQTNAESYKTNWTVCTYGDTRYAWNKSLNQNKGSYEILNVTEKLKDLFNEYNIDYINCTDIKDEITKLSDPKFLIKLIKYLQVVLAMRYSYAEHNKDFILSPIKNESGKFYNSEDKIATLPQDADANGAYHIALKGLWSLNQINNTDDLNKIKLAISNKEWLEFVQEKPYKK